MHWDQADGWLTPAEGEKLAELASGRRVIELGCYEGRSTLSMARTADHVVSVDWHRGDCHMGEKDTLGAFWRNLTAAGIRDKVTPVVGRFPVAELFTPSTFGLVFVDGEHTYEAAYYDIGLAARLVTPNGLVALHDYAANVYEAAAARGFRALGQVHSLAWGVIA